MLCNTTSSLIVRGAESAVHYGEAAQRGLTPCTALSAAGGGGHERSGARRGGGGGEAPVSEAPAPSEGRAAARWRAA
ncbi:hypothetical protein EMIHUDRAFT_369118, partial [Emiliania huxleyi CCMP1516]|uniref:Uncharacterized protein n=2 Tax=Emiliania huxleyi TaxID=2903 RepID=A0A0D3JA55_EMIH1